jgi:hypothetical protein
MEGGKTEEDNKRNFETRWKNKCQEDYCIEPYDPCREYPGWLGTNFYGAKPFRKKNCYTQKVTNKADLVNTSTIKSQEPSETSMLLSKTISEKTIVFQRHAFSCANLSKSKGLSNVWNENEKDPSLCMYGILSTLSLNRTNHLDPTPQFKGKLFVSSLIRTWQTAILEFAPLTNRLIIFISPFIIEGGINFFSSNIPLDETSQNYKMAQFMTILQNIHSMTTSNEALHRKLERILECDILILKDGREIFRYKRGAVQPAKMVGGFKIPNYTFTYNEETVTGSIEIPPLPFPTENIYTTYFGEKGLSYFYQWLSRQYYPDKYVFVVGHGNFMRKVIEKYSDVTEIESTKYSDENLWRFEIEGNRVVLSHGIPKPDKALAASMIDEPLCYLKLKHSQQPITFVDSKSKESKYGTIEEDRKQLVALYEPKRSEETRPNRRRKDFESGLFNPGKEESKESGPTKDMLKEWEESNKPENMEKRWEEQRTKTEEYNCDHRSIDEFILLLKTHAASLFGFMNRSDIGEKEIEEYIKSTPDLFQNHLMCSSLFNTTLLNDLMTTKIDRVYRMANWLPVPNLWGARDYALQKAVYIYLYTFYESRFKGIKDIPFSAMKLDNVVRFLRILIDLLNQKKILGVLYETCEANANRHYKYTEMNVVNRSMQALKEEAAANNKSVKQTDIDKMMEELAKEAEKEKKPPPTKEDPEIVYCFTLLDLLVFKITKERYIESSDGLTGYLDCISKLINGGARFSDGKKLLPLNSKGAEKYRYIQQHVFNKLAVIPYYQLWAQDIIAEQSELLQSGAGKTRRFKGTSSKKTSLRRLLVKRATRRALPYKGKRRSRANRR